MNNDSCIDHNHPLATSIESDGFDCPLCLEHLYKPSAASCGHVFCGRCIQVLNKTGSQCPFRCPNSTITPAPLPQIAKMLEMNDHRIAKIVHQEEEVQHLTDKVEKLSHMLLEQDKRHREMVEHMKNNQAPNCCIARLLYYMFPPPPLPPIT